MKAKHNYSEIPNHGDFEVRWNFKNRINWLSAHTTDVEMKRSENICKPEKFKICQFPVIMGLSVYDYSLIKQICHRFQLYFSVCHKGQIAF